MARPISLLTSLGYSENESRIYLALLELGEGTIMDIAKKSGIRRTSLYPLVSKLLADGIIKKTLKKKRKYFYVEDVDDLKQMLNDKERKLNEALPELKAIHNILPNKPKITYYEGAGGLRDFYLHILDSLVPGDTIYEFVGASGFAERLPSEFVDFYPKERVKRKIQIQTIASESPESKKWLVEAGKFLRQVEFSGQKADFSANLQIYKNGIGIISYQPNIMGIIIEDRNISSMFMTAYQMMWQSAKSLQK